MGDEPLYWFCDGLKLILADLGVWVLTGFGLGLTFPGLLPGPLCHSQLLAEPVGSSLRSPGPLHCSWWMFPLLLSWAMQSALHWSGTQGFTDKFLG